MKTENNNYHSNDYQSDRSCALSCPISPISSNEWIKVRW